MQRLEAVGNRNSSIFDTVVREKMGDPIFCLFIKPKPGYVMPDEYGMGDRTTRLSRLLSGSTSTRRWPSHQSST